MCFFLVTNPTVYTWCYADITSNLEMNASAKSLSNLFFFRNSKVGVWSLMELVTSLRFVRSYEVFLSEMSALILSAFEQYLSVVQTSCPWVRLSPWDEIVTSDKVMSGDNCAAVILKASACLFATQTLMTLRGCISGRFPSFDLLDGLFC